MSNGHLLVRGDAPLSLFRARAEPESLLGLIS